MATRKTTIQKEDWNSIEKRIERKQQIKATAKTDREAEKEARSAKSAAETRALRRTQDQQKRLIQKRKKLEGTVEEEIPDKMKPQIIALEHQAKRMNTLNDQLIVKKLAGTVSSEEESRRRMIAQARAHDQHKMEAIKSMLTHIEPESIDNDWS